MTETITLAAAVAQRDAYLQASLDLARGKTSTIGNRQYNRADADEIQKMLNYWNRAIKNIRAASAVSSAESVALSPGIATAVRLSAFAASGRR